MCGGTDEHDRSPTDRGDEADRREMASAVCDPSPGWGTEAFKLSADPLFLEKVRNMAGLYLQPPG